MAIIQEFKPAREVSVVSEEKKAEALEFIDQLRKGPPERNGMVDEPDVIVTMRLAKGAKKK